MSSLPDFLIAGGSEAEWIALHASDRAGFPALVEEPDEADAEGEQQEVLIKQTEPATESATADETSAQPSSEPAAADDSDSDSSDSSSDSDKEDATADPAVDADGLGAPRLGRSSLLGPLSSANAAPMLLDEDDLCVNTNATAASSVAASAGVGAAAATAPADDDSLVEYEILMDGEVVGTTFLPKQKSGEAPAALGATVAAEAIKNARKRKFEERMGVQPSAAAAVAAASGPFVPQPPALCSACQKVQAKYKCPKCDLGTCSLACVNAHKVSTGCTGVRSRTSYIPLSSMTSATLSRDLHFLTEMERLAGSATRDANMKDKKGETIVLAAQDASMPFPSEASKELGGLFGCSAQHLDSRSFTLMSAAQQQRNTRLMMMPQGMKMHTQNMSRVYAISATAPTPSTKGHKKGPRSGPPAPDLSPSSSCIKWTVHLLFKHRAVTQAGPQTDLRVVKHKIDERLTWAQLLDSVLQVPPPVASVESVAASAPVDAAAERKAALQAIHPSRRQTKAAEITLKSTSTALLRHQLAAFITPTPAASTDVAAAASSKAPSASSSSPYSHLYLLLQVPFQPANAPLFHRVTAGSTILASLKNQTLVEHPVLWVVTEADRASYNIEQKSESHMPQLSNKTMSSKKAAGATPASKEEALPPKKKAKRTSAEGERIEATAETVPAGSVLPVATAAADATPVAARPAPAAALAYARPTSMDTDDGASSASHRGRGGRGGRGNWRGSSDGSRGGRGGGFDGAGRGRGGRGGGNWSDRGGRDGSSDGGGGRGRCRGGFDRGGRGGGAAAPSFSFGVAKPQAPAAAAASAPPPPVAPAASASSSLFKKWA